MKYLLSTILVVLLPTKSIAGAFNWKLILVDQKTKERKEFAPEQTALNIAGTGPFQCALESSIDLSDSKLLGEKSYLSCVYKDSKIATKASCYNSRDPQLSFKDSLTTSLLAMHKDVHLFTLILSCENI